MYGSHEESNSFYKEIKIKIYKFDRLYGKQVNIKGTKVFWIVLDSRTAQEGAKVDTVFSTISRAQNSYGRHWWDVL